MVFDDGSHIRPCSNFGRRVSDRPIDADRKDRRRRGAPRVPPDEARARPCVTRSRIVCYKPTVSTLLLAGTTFSLTRIHANRRIHGSREELARVFEKSIGIGRGIYARSSSKKMGRKERWVLLL